jgi:hypothetical protein
MGVPKYNVSLENYVIFNKPVSLKYSKVEMSENTKKN